MINLFDKHEVSRESIVFIFTQFRVPKIIIFQTELEHKWSSFWTSPFDNWSDLQVCQNICLFSTGGVTHSQGKSIEKSTLLLDGNPHLHFRLMVTPEQMIC